jgi:hypothetical protein
LISRYRYEEWSLLIVRHRDEVQRPGALRRHREWQRIMPIVQEILLAEPLTRMLAFHFSACERHGGASENASVARNVLANHLDARHKCLNLIVFSPGLSVEDAVRLNRLRRIMESYTDQLLAIMHPTQDASMYAFETEEVARNQERLALLQFPEKWIHLQAMGLRENLSKSVLGEIDVRHGMGRLNQRLSEIVLAMFPEDMFDSFGMPHPLTMGRLRAVSPESTGRSNDLTEPLCSPLNVLAARPRLSNQTDRTMRSRWE